MSAICRGHRVGEGKRWWTRVESETGDGRKMGGRKMAQREGGADRPPGSRPGGTPEEISRGQVRASGRRPRKPCRGAPCPSGASKKWPVMPDDLQRPDLSEATSGDGDAAGGRRQKLLRCPAGAWPVRRGNRGPRPLARACPRLISCGVPPGPSARRRRPFSDGLLVGSAAENPRAPRRFFLEHG